MAQKFVLTAQLDLQSPKNVPQVVRQIRSQLKGMDVDLKVKSSPREMVQTAKQLSSIDKEGKKAAASTHKLGKTLGSAARRFAAFSVATGTFLALARAIKGGTTEAIEFERELIRISQVTGKSVSQLKGLTKEVTSLSRSLGASSSELLNAARTLSQAGFSAEKAQKALKILAQTDLAATFDNINDTTEGSIALLRQFSAEARKAGGEIKFLEQSLDAINAVSKKFAVESSDLITVIRRTGGVFEAAGGKLNELISLFTSVRATTRESAETIAVGFRTIFTRIQRSETIDQLKELGIVLQDAKGQFVGPLEAINRLAMGLKALDPRDYRFNEIVESLGGFRQIGKVIPLIKQFTTAQEALNVAQGASGSTAKDALTAQQSLGVQIKKLRQDFAGLMRDFIDTSSFRTMTKAFFGFAESLIKIADALKPLLPMLLSLAAIKIGRGLAPSLAGFTGMKKGVGTTTRAQGGIIKMARGGMVPGSGNRDTVPAMLTPGEFVIKKSSVRKMGSRQLKAMNENRYKHGGIHLSESTFKPEAGMKARTLDEPAKRPRKGTTTRIGGAFLRTSKEAAPFRRRLVTTLTDKDFKGQEAVKKGPSNIGGAGDAARTASILEALGGKKNQIIVEIISGKIPVKVAHKYEDQLRRVTAGPAKKVISEWTGGGFNKQSYNKALDMANFEQVSGNLFEAALAGSTGKWDDSRTTANAPFDYPSGLGSKVGRKLRIPGQIPTDAKRSFSPESLASLVKKARNVVLRQAASAGRGAARQDAIKRGGGTTGAQLMGMFGEDTVKKARKTALKGGYQVTEGARGKYTVVKKAAGGSISGSDTVPALLTPGEFVINKASAQRIGYGNLGRMNRKGYAAGGVVAHGRHAYGNGPQAVATAAAPPPDDPFKTFRQVLKKYEAQVNILTRSFSEGTATQDATTIALKVFSREIRDGASAQDALEQATKRQKNDMENFAGGDLREFEGRPGATRGSSGFGWERRAEGINRGKFAAASKVSASGDVAVDLEGLGVGSRELGVALASYKVAIVNGKTHEEALINATQGAEKAQKRRLKTWDKDDKAAKALIASQKKLEKAQEKAAKRAKLAEGGARVGKEAQERGDKIGRAGTKVQEIAFMGTAAALTAVQFANLSAESEKAATQTVALMGALANGVGTIMQITGPLVTSFGGMIANVTASMATKAAESAASLASAAADTVETGASGASAVADTVETVASGGAAVADVGETGATLAATAALGPFAIAVAVVGAAFVAVGVAAAAVVGYFAFLAFKSKALAESQSKQNDEMLKALGEGKGSIEDFVSGVETEARHNEQAAKHTRKAVKAGGWALTGGLAAAGGMVLGPFGALGGAAIGLGLKLAGAEEKVNDYLGASKAEASIRDVQMNQLKSSAQALGELTLQAHKTRSAFEDIERDETLDPQQRAEKVAAVAGEGRAEQFRKTRAAQGRLADMGVVGPLGDEQKKKLIETGGVGGKEMTKIQQQQLNIDLASVGAGLQHFETVTKETSKSLKAIAAVEFQEKTFSELIAEGGAYVAALKASRQAVLDEARIKASQTSDVSKQRQIMRDAHQTNRRNLANQKKQSAAAKTLRMRTQALNLMFAKQRQSMHRALNVIDRFDDLARGLARVEKSFNNLSAVIDGTSQDFSAIPIKGLDDLGKVGNIRNFNKDIDQLTAGMGPAGQQIGSEVKKTAEIMRKGRGVIGQKRGVVGKAGQTVEAGKILKDMGITEADVGPELFGVLKKGIMEALKTGGMIDPDEFEQIFAPLVKASKHNVDALKKIQEVQNTYINMYAANIDLLMQTMDKERELRAGMVDIQQRGAERMAEARGGSLSGRANELFRTRRAQENLRGVREGGTGRQLRAGDVSGAAKTLQKAEAERQRIRSQLNNADFAQKKKLIEQDKLAQNAANKARAELERLADQSARAADVLGEIEKLRAGREAKMGLLEKFVVGGKDERQEIAKSFAGLQRAMSTGTLQSMPVEFRKLTVGLLDQFKDVRIPGAGGLTGQQVKQQLVLGDAVRMGLVSAEMAQGLATGLPEEQRLLTELGNINQQELDAQKALLQNAKSHTNFARATAKNTAAILGQIKSRGGPAGGPVPATAIASGGLVYRAAGGSIFQPRGTDTVPAMLTPGEFVIKKSSVDKVGTGFLHSINSGPGTVYRKFGGSIPRGGRDFTGLEGAVNIGSEGSARQMMGERLKKLGVHKFKMFSRQAGFTKSMVARTMKVISEGRYDFMNNVAAKVVADTTGWLSSWKHLFSVADSRRVGFKSDAGGDVSKLIGGLAKHSILSEKVGGGAAYRKASFKLAGLVAPQYLSQIKSIREAASVWFAKGEVTRRRRAGKYVPDNMLAAAGLDRVRDIDEVEGVGARAAKRAATGMGGGFKRVPRRDHRGNIYRVKGKIQYKVVPRFGQAAQQLFGVDQEDMGTDWQKKGKKERRVSVAAFARGGSVDSIPAMLTPGEFVMSRGAVQKHGVGFMNQLNRGNVQGFNKGGVVYAQGGRHMRFEGGGGGGSTLPSEMTKGNWPISQRLDPKGEPGLYRHWEHLSYAGYRERVERARKVAGLQARGYHTHVSKTRGVTPQFQNPLGPTAIRGTIGQSPILQSPLYRPEGALMPLLRWPVTNVASTRAFRQAALAEPIPQGARRERVRQKDEEDAARRKKEYAEYKKKQALLPLTKEMRDEYKKARYEDWPNLRREVGSAGVHATKDGYIWIWKNRKKNLQKAMRELQYKNRFRSEGMPSFAEQRQDRKRVGTHRQEIAYMDQLLKGSSKTEEAEAAKKSEATIQGNWEKIGRVKSAVLGVVQTATEVQKKEKANKEAQKLAEEQEKVRKEELSKVEELAGYWSQYLRNTPWRPMRLGAGSPAATRTVPGTAYTYTATANRVRQRQVRSGDALPFSAEETLGVPIAASNQGIEALGGLYKDMDRVMKQAERDKWIRTFRDSRKKSRTTALTAIQIERRRAKRARDFAQKAEKLDVEDRPIAPIVTPEEMARADSISGLSPNARAAALEEMRQEEEADRNQKEAEKQADRRFKNLEHLRKRRRTTGRRGVRTFAQGGPVYLQSGGMFQPRGTDTVPAMLTPGEFVMRKSAVDQVGTGVLSAINAGHFADGGLVSYLQEGSTSRVREEDRGKSGPQLRKEGALKGLSPLDVPGGFYEYRYFEKAAETKERMKDPKYAAWVKKYDRDNRKQRGPALNQRVEHAEYQMGEIFKSDEPNHMSKEHSLYGDYADKLDNLRNLRRTWYRLKYQRDTAERRNLGHRMQDEGLDVHGIVDFIGTKQIAEGAISEREQKDYKAHGGRLLIGKQDHPAGFRPGIPVDDIADHTREAETWVKHYQGLTGQKVLRAEGKEWADAKAAYAAENPSAASQVLRWITTNPKTNKSRQGMRAFEMLQGVGKFFGQGVKAYGSAWGAAITGLVDPFDMHETYKDNMSEAGITALEGLAQWYTGGEYLRSIKEEGKYHQDIQEEQEKLQREFGKGTMARDPLVEIEQWTDFLTEVAGEEVPFLGLGMAWGGLKKFMGGVGDATRLRAGMQAADMPGSAKYLTSLADTGAEIIPAATNAQRSVKQTIRPAATSNLRNTPPPPRKPLKLADLQVDESIALTQQMDAVDAAHVATGERAIHGRSLGAKYSPDTEGRSSRHWLDKAKQQTEEIARIERAGPEHFKAEMPREKMLEKANNRLLKYQERAAQARRAELEERELRQALDELRVAEQDLEIQGYLEGEGPARTSSEAVKGRSQQGRQAATAAERKALEKRIAQEEKKLANMVKQHKKGKVSQQAVDDQINKITAMKSKSPTQLRSQKQFATAAEEAAAREAWWDRQPNQASVTADIHAEAKTIKSGELEAKLKEEELKLAKMRKAGGAMTYGQTKIDAQKQLITDMNTKHKDLLFTAAKDLKRKATRHEIFDAQTAWVKEGARNKFITEDEMKNILPGANRTEEAKQQFGTGLNFDELQKAKRNNDQRRVAKMSQREREAWEAERVKKLKKKQQKIEKANELRRKEKLKKQQQIEQQRAVETDTRVRKEAEERQLIRAAQDRQVFEKDFLEVHDPLEPQPLPVGYWRGTEQLQKFHKKWGPDWKAKAGLEGQTSLQPGSVMTRTTTPIEEVASLEKRLQRREGQLSDVEEIQNWLKVNKGLDTDLPATKFLRGQIDSLRSQQIKALEKVPGNTGMGPGFGGGGALRDEAEALRSQIDATSDAAEIARLERDYENLILAREGHARSAGTGSKLSPDEAVRARYSGLDRPAMEKLRKEKPSEWEAARNEWQNRVLIAAEEEYAALRSAWKKEGRDRGFVKKSGRGRLSIPEQRKIIAAQREEEALGALDPDDVSGHLKIMGERDARVAASTPKPATITREQQIANQKTYEDAYDTFVSFTPNNNPIDPASPQFMPRPLGFEAFPTFGELFGRTRGWNIGKKAKEYQKRLDAYRDAVFRHDNMQGTGWRGRSFPDIHGVMAGFPEVVEGRVSGQTHVVSGILPGDRGETERLILQWVDSNPYDEATQVAEIVKAAEVAEVAEVAEIVKATTFGFEAVKPGKFSAANPEDWPKMWGIRSPYSAGTVPNAWTRDVIGQLDPGRARAHLIKKIQENPHGAAEALKVTVSQLEEAFGFKAKPLMPTFERIEGGGGSGFTEALWRAYREPRSNYRMVPGVAADPWKGPRDLDHLDPNMIMLERQLSKLRKMHKLGTVYKAAGGSIFKPRGTDTVPAMLTPGEFVIRKSAVDQVGTGVLGAINAGHFAGGGLVSYLAEGGLADNALFKDEQQQAFLAQMKNEFGATMGGWNNPWPWPGGDQEVAPTKLRDLGAGKPVRGFGELPLGHEDIDLMGPELRKFMEEEAERRRSRLLERGANIPMKNIYGWHDSTSVGVMINSGGKYSDYSAQMVPDRLQGVYYNTPDLWNQVWANRDAQTTEQFELIVAKYWDQVAALAPIDPTMKHDEAMGRDMGHFFRNITLDDLLRQDWEMGTMVQIGGAPLQGMGGLGGGLGGAFMPGPGFELIQPDATLPMGQGMPPESFRKWVEARDIYNVEAQRMLGAIAFEQMENAGMGPLNQKLRAWEVPKDTSFTKPLQVPDGDGPFGGMDGLGGDMGGLGGGMKESPAKDLNPFDLDEKFGPIENKASGGLVSYLQTGSQKPEQRKSGSVRLREDQKPYSYWWNDLDARSQRELEYNWEGQMRGHPSDYEPINRLPGQHGPLSPPDMYDMRGTSDIGGFTGLYGRKPSGDPRDRELGGGDFRYTNSTAADQREQARRNEERWRKSGGWDQRKKKGSFQSYLEGVYKGTRIVAPPVSQSPKNKTIKKGVKSIFHQAGGLVSYLQPGGDVMEKGRKIEAERLKHFAEQMRIGEKIGAFRDIDAKRRGPAPKSDLQRFAASQGQGFMDLANFVGGGAQMGWNELAAAFFGARSGLAKGAQHLPGGGLYLGDPEELLETAQLHRGVSKDLFKNLWQDPNALAKSKEKGGAFAKLREERPDQAELIQQAHLIEAPFAARAALTGGAKLMSSGKHWLRGTKAPVDIAKDFGKGVNLNKYNTPEAKKAQGFERADEMAKAKLAPGSEDFVKKYSTFRKELQIESDRQLAAWEAAGRPDRHDIGPFAGPVGFSLEQRTPTRSQLKGMGEWGKKVAALEHLFYLNRSGKLKKLQQLSPMERSLNPDYQSVLDAMTKYGGVMDESMPGKYLMAPGKAGKAAAQKPTDFVGKTLEELKILREQAAAQFEGKQVTPETTLAHQEAKQIDKLIKIKEQIEKLKSSGGTGETTVPGGSRQSNIRSLQQQFNDIMREKGVFGEVTPDVSKKLSDLQKRMAQARWGHLDAGPTSAKQVMDKGAAWDEAIKKSFDPNVLKKPSGPFGEGASLMDVGSKPEGWKWPWPPKTSRNAQGGLVSYLQRGGSGRAGGGYPRGGVGGSIFRNWRPQRTPEEIERINADIVFQNMQMGFGGEGYKEFEGHTKWDIIKSLFRQDMKTMDLENLPARPGEVRAPLPPKKTLPRFRGWEVTKELFQRNLKKPDGSPRDSLLPIQREAKSFKDIERKMTDEAMEAERTKPPLPDVFRELFLRNLKEPEGRAGGGLVSYLQNGGRGREGEFYGSRQSQISRVRKIQSAKEREEQARKLREENIRMAKKFHPLAQRSGTISQGDQNLLDKGWTRRAGGGWNPPGKDADLKKINKAVKAAPPDDLLRMLKKGPFAPGGDDWNPANILDADEIKKQKQEEAKRREEERRQWRINRNNMKDRNRLPWWLRGALPGWNNAPGMQRGGNVDSIPAMLTPGEFVMSRGAVQRYGTSFMGKLNEGQLPGFNKGGPVYAENGINVQPRAGVDYAGPDMAAEFAKVGAALSEDLGTIFGTMEFHHRVTVDGQLNIGGINSEVVANAIRDALASYVVGEVKKGLENAKKYFRSGE